MIPATPPPVVEKHPADQYTVGTKLWVGLLTAGAVLEAYGLWYDWKHPGNREKWTLTSNVRTWGGFDSITGEPVDVPGGAFRRTGVLLSTYWAQNHWTRTRNTF